MFTDFDKIRSGQRFARVVVCAEDILYDERFPESEYGRRPEAVGFSFQPRGMGSWLVAPVRTYLTNNRFEAEGLRKHYENPFYPEGGMRDLIITSPRHHRFVEFMKDNGLVVACYDEDYDRVPYGTVERRASEGYSLQLPADPITLERFISDVAFIEGVVLRDEQRIRTAIDGINTKVPVPVRATAHLPLALRPKAWYPL
jgi:hypothetical protein